MKTPVTYKNVTLQNIANLSFTPNSLFLIKETSTGNINVLELCEVNKTDSLSVIKAVLTCLLAEYKYNEDEKALREMVNEKARTISNSFLNCMTVFKTDCDGKINRALVCDLKLKEIGFKITDKHTIVTCTPQNLRAAVHCHAKLIEKRSNMLCAINSTIKAINQLVLSVKTVENENQTAKTEKAENQTAKTEKAENQTAKTEKAEKKTTKKAA